MTNPESEAVALLARVLGAELVVTPEQVGAADEKVRRTDRGDDVAGPVAVNQHPESNERAPRDGTPSAAVGRAWHLDSMGTSTPLSLVNRVARPDYQRWAAGALSAGGCVRPVRLRPTMFQADPATGELLPAAGDLPDAPDGVVYKPCGDRRASVCPPCAERYRQDTWQLIAAGLRGGKGVPAEVAGHPAVFLTLTAPSFGLVHAQDPRRHRVASTATAAVNHG